MELSRLAPTAEGKRPRGAATGVARAQRSGARRTVAGGVGPRERVPGLTAVARTRGGLSLRTSALFQRYAQTGKRVCYASPPSHARLNEASGSTGAPTQ